MQSDATGGCGMAYTLSEAAKATGLNKTTIFRAIRKGQISGSKDATTGQWSVEPAELHRVYPAVAGNDAAEAIASPRNTVAEVEIREIRARLGDAHATIEDLRRQRDQADTDRRQALDRLAAAQERITALLTDQRPAPAVSPARPWWPWRRT
jgi:chromosome segregation ATPase